jgi:YegS/Rv2252/BmrU family lipid kinase
MAASVASTRLLIVLNPVSGSSDPEHVRHTLHEIFGQAGVAYTIHETTEHESLDTVIRQAQHDSYTMVVAAGGDGTVSAVADVLVQHPVPLGIIPLGTGNAVARELGIPLQCEAACQVLLQSRRTRRLDAMRIDDRIYLSHISLGIYAHIIAKTIRRAKQRFGRFAYLWPILQELRDLKTWPFRVTIDGKPHDVRASLLLMANVGAAGLGQMRWGPHVRPDDGAIDVCMVHLPTLADYASFLWHIWLGHPHQAKQITYLQAKQSVDIETPAPLPIRADGEIIGQSTVRFQVQPQALEVIVP